MKHVKPHVYLIGDSALRAEEIARYVESIGAPDWTTDAASPAEKIIELAGRVCYRSFAPGLNANVTKVREGNAHYMANILQQKHGSVLEHGHTIWLFHQVSRVFTHELVRHRVGVGISQESLRYVRLTDLPIWTPDWAQADEELMARNAALADHMESHQRWMTEHFGLDEPGADFSLKKHKTSYMRRWAPIGLATTILWSSNLRNLRHVIEQRTSSGAEEEIRLVFDTVAAQAKVLYPAVFQDFTRTDDGVWFPGARKV